MPLDRQLPPPGADYFSVRIDFSAAHAISGTQCLAG
jgi:hypothetical protein